MRKVIWLFTFANNYFPTASVKDILDQLTLLHGKTWSLFLGILLRYLILSILKWFNGSGVVSLPKLPKCYPLGRDHNQLHLRGQDLVHGELLILIVADYNMACGELDRSVCCAVRCDRFRVQLKIIRWRYKDQSSQHDLKKSLPHLKFLCIGQALSWAAGASLYWYWAHWA